MITEKVITAWRTIYAILQETGYDKLYEEEIKTLVAFIREHIKKGKWCWVITEEELEKILIQREDEEENK